MRVLGGFDEIVMRFCVNFILVLSQYVGLFINISYSLLLIYRFHIASLYWIILLIYTI